MCTIPNKTLSSLNRRRKSANRLENRRGNSNFQEGNKGDLQDYRPISSISHICKLFTRIIINRITDKLDAFEPPE